MMNQRQCPRQLPRQCQRQCPRQLPSDEPSSLPDTRRHSDTQMSMLMRVHASVCVGGGSRSVGRGENASLCDGDVSLCGGETESSASRSQSMRIMSECMWCVGHDGCITAIQQPPNATFSVNVTQHYCQRGRVVTCDCCEKKNVEC